LETSFSAEEEGFEPPDLLQSAVFKTAAIDHSATPLGLVATLKLTNKRLSKRRKAFCREGEVALRLAESLSMAQR
jgi:hypothetical protein